MQSRRTLDAVISDVCLLFLAVAQHYNPYMSQIVHLLCLPIAVCSVVNPHLIDGAKAYCEVLRKRQ